MLKVGTSCLIAVSTPLATKVAPELNANSHADRGDSKEPFGVYGDIVPVLDAGEACPFVNP